MQLQYCARVEDKWSATPAAFQQLPQACCCAPCHAQAPGAAPPPPAAPAAKKADGDADAPPEDDTKFDEFMGNDAGAFANVGEYDQDDKEADVVRRYWPHCRSHCMRLTRMHASMPQGPFVFAVHAPYSMLSSEYSCMRFAQQLPGG